MSQGSRISNMFSSPRQAWLHFQFHIVASIQGLRVTCLTSVALHNGGGRIYNSFISISFMTLKPAKDRTLQSFITKLGEFWPP